MSFSPKLTLHPQPNIAIWREALLSYIRASFGEIAKHFESQDPDEEIGELTIPDPPRSRGGEQSAAKGEEPEWAAKFIWQEQARLILKKNEERIHQLARICGIIIQSLANDSLLRVRSQPDFADFVKDNKALELYRLCESTHEGTETAKASKAIQHRIGFDLQQESMSLEEYIGDASDKVAAAKRAGVKIPEDELAHRFFLGLQTETFGTYVGELLSSSSVPDTFSKATQAAMEWHRGQSGAGVFAKSRTQPSAMYTAPHPKLKRSCIFCKKTNHDIGDCRVAKEYCSKKDKKREHHKEKEHRALHTTLDEESEFVFNSFGGNHG